MFGSLLSRTLSVCVCYSSMKWLGEGLPGLVHEISEWIEYCINRLWEDYIKAIIEVLPITFSNSPELSAYCSRKTLRTLVIFKVWDIIPPSCFGIIALTLQTLAPSVRRMNILQLSKAGICHIKGPVHCCWFVPQMLHGTGYIFLDSA